MEYALSDSGLRRLIENHHIDFSTPYDIESKVSLSRVLDHTTNGTSSAVHQTLANSKMDDKDVDNVDHFKTPSYHDTTTTIPITAATTAAATIASIPVQPASIDVPISGPCYLVKHKILPFGCKVREVINDVKLSEIPFASAANSQSPKSDMTFSSSNSMVSEEKTLLLKGQTYLVYCGRISLPPRTRGSLSPKSSIGRVDIMVRAVFDDCGLYDTIESGKSGELWMEISPRSFNILVKPGLCLSQLMVFEESPNAPLSSPHPLLDPSFANTLLYDQSGNSLPLKMHNGSLVLSLSVPTSSMGKSRIVGFEALPTSEPIDLTRIRHLDPNQFFRPLWITGDDNTYHSPKRICHDSMQLSSKIIPSVTLEKDKFYILATKERISIPLELSAEMVPFSQHIGELRAHYAGFFDPGFGYSSDGSLKGTVGVLEVRPHETITVFDGQPIALMQYYRNKEVPKVPYGNAGNHYQHQQGPKLSKYFKED